MSDSHDQAPASASNEPGESSGEPGEPRHPITRWLSGTSPGMFAVYAVVMAFTTYLCMYSYRKPFGAATYDEQTFWILDLKTALVVSQLIGYATSKFLGIKYNSEMAPHRRAWALVILIVWAQLALVLFAFMPPGGKVFAILLNGLPLGMIWGLVFSFLEGRRTSEILGAGLSCSYIVASGWVKTVGKWLMTEHGISESWMPATTGLLFFPLFLLTVYGLSLLPPPTKEDQESRVIRVPMFRDERRAFVKRYFFGLLVLVLVYFFLTAYRDFRDNYAAEIWRDLGYGDAPEVFTLSELPVAFAVMLALSLLYLIKNNRIGLLGCFGIMIAGSALIGVSTLLFDLGVVNGMVWMILVGTGAYLAYVPYGCVLFDRMIAALGVVATAVFLIYVADAFAYGGAVGVQLYRALATPDLAFKDFFRALSYITSIATTGLFVISGVYFVRRAKHE